MIVMKFGGTSTKDAARIANVVQIVQSRLECKPFVVISAIAQATNVLERAGKLAADGHIGEARDTLLKLFDRHYAIVDALVKDRDRHVALRKIITGSLAELEEIIKGVAILREITPRTLDSIYCYGELLSSHIVAAALQERGTDAVWLDTKDFMVTDENFTRAMPLMDIVTDRLTELATPIIAEGRIPVTQGFIGVTQAGRRSTMGRESSDYSAAIIGAALNADDIQIWTDVDGVLTADPNVVQSPKKVKMLSFEEAFELSYFGAKVLHPNTMLPAIEKSIPIHIFNSYRPHLSGTMVTRRHTTDGSLIKSVAYKRDAIVLTVRPKARYGQNIFWEHVNSVLTKYDATASMTVTSEYNYALVLDDKFNLDAIVHDLSGIGIVDVLAGKGIVCVVGTNIRPASHLVDRIFRSISEFGVVMISFGASNSNLSFVLDDLAVPDAVRKIHAEFFETRTDEKVFETLEHLQVVKSN